MSQPTASNGAATLDAATLDGLRHLASRADEIVFFVDMLGGLVARGPEIADNLNDAVQEARKMTGSAYKTAVNDDAERAAKAGAAKAARGDGAPLPGERYAHGAVTAEEPAWSPEATLEATLKLLKLATPENVDQLETSVVTVQRTLASPQVQSLLQSSVLDPEAVAAVSQLAEALVYSTRHAQEQPGEKLGFFGLIRALRDPDVARSLAFFVDVARAFGQRVETMELPRRGSSMRPRR